MKAHRWEDGSEEQGPRSEEEIAAIIEANRIASQANLRSGKERRTLESDTCMSDENVYYFSAPRWERCRRESTRRTIISTMEIATLLGKF